FFASRRRHTRSLCDWSSDVCSRFLALAETLGPCYPPPGVDFGPAAHPFGYQCGMSPKRPSSPLAGRRPQHWEAEPGVGGPPEAFVPPQNSHGRNSHVTADFPCAGQDDAHAVEIMGVCGVADRFQLSGHLRSPSDGPGLPPTWFSVRRCPPPSGGFLEPPNFLPRVVKEPYIRPLFGGEGKPCTDLPL